MRDSFSVLKANAVQIFKNKGVTSFKTVSEQDFADDQCILRDIDSDVLAGARAASFSCTLWGIRGDYRHSDSGS
jgi:hypothetical protein